jgi:hypothetical protein
VRVYGTDRNLQTSCLACDVLFKVALPLPGSSAGVHAALVVTDVPSAYATFCESRNFFPLPK